MQDKDEPFAREGFFRARTPAALRRYVKGTRERIAANSEWRKAARVGSGLYKRFREELIPFSHYCTWKYDDREDVRCRLIEGTRGGDGIVAEGDPQREHCIEITCPIDGKWDARQRRLINEEGCSDVEIWDTKDISLQSAAVARVIKAAHKKASRDYGLSGGSTLILVLNMTLHWSNIPEHRQLFARLIGELSRIPMHVDEVLLMTFFGEEVKIFPVEYVPRGTGAGLRGYQRD